ncbi:MAG: hypothetical protein DHS20C15_01140 [Planctomycetota bacterium]|nr:MAG: hypothetical protein DHS20C15_01140 [Planctomycetota bacterium]
MIKATFSSAVGGWLAAALLTLASNSPEPDEFAKALLANDWGEVEALARERLAVNSEDLQAHAGLGRALLERMRGLAGRPGLATELAVSAANQAVAHLAAARELEGVHDLWLEARAEHPRPEDGLDRALAELAQAGDPHAGFLWARAQPAAESEAALDALAAALALRPERSDYLLAALARRVALGRMDAARNTWRAAAERGANVDTLAAWCGELWGGSEQAGARAEALGWLVELRDLSGDAWLGWYRAHALAQQGKQEEALQVFEASQVGAPAAVQRAHAALLQSLGREREAAQLLIPLANDSDWDAYEELVSLADASALRRDFEFSLELYESALAIEQRHERAQHHRALTLWRAGRESDAEAAFDELFERWPARSDLLNDGGLAALGAGNTARAARLFELAAELPQSVDAQENRAALGLAVDDLPRAELFGLLNRVLDAEPQRSRALVLRSRARSDP